MKFQVFSDIHLEYHDTYPYIPSLAPYLILAGDIGSGHLLREFLIYCSKNWRKTFMVMGNHDYYTEHKDNMIDILAQLRKDLPENVYLLDNEIHEIEPGWRIIGSTLWSDPETELGFSDFQNIYVNNKHISLFDFRRLHKEAVSFIKSAITTKTIIVTHFPPTYEAASHPIYHRKNSAHRRYFSSEILSTLSSKEEIACWVFGHTHYSIDTIVNNIRLIANQIGYPGEQCTFKSSPFVIGESTAD